MIYAGRHAHHTLHADIMDRHGHEAPRERFAKGLKGIKGRDDLSAPLGSPSNVSEVSRAKLGVFARTEARKYPAWNSP